MKITVKGHVVGRPVEVTKDGAKIKGDVSVIQMAQEDVNAGLDLAPHPTLPQAVANLTHDESFVVTIIEQLDPGTWEYTGIDLGQPPEGAIL